MIRSQYQIKRTRLPVQHLLIGLIMNHDSAWLDRPEIFQNSLIEHTPKAAFWALNLSIKHFRPFPSDLKTDKEVLKTRETV